MTRAVYMDYNATAPVAPAVVEAVAGALETYGNPSSVHRFGRRARRAIDDAREAVAALIGAPAPAVIFTSGGTEANNLAITGAGGRDEGAGERRDGAGRRLIVSAIEHDSVMAAAPGAEIIPVTAEGVVDLAALGELLARGARPALVSVMLANNETGVIQPVAEAAALAHARGALLHCDAVQAAGKMAVDMDRLGADLLSLSAHKLGGPKGVGALAVRDGVSVRAGLRGGGQERGRRAGTENVAGIAGFAAAAGLAGDGLAAFARLSRLRDRLEGGLRDLAPAVTVFGAGAPRLANTTCFAAPGLAGETQVMALDLAGIAVSAGAACSSGKVEPSRVLRAMGAGEETAACAIRVSLGRASDNQDVDRFLAVWGGLYKAKRAAPAPAARGAA